MQQLAEGLHLRTVACGMSQDEEGGGCAMATRRGETGPLPAFAAVTQHVNKMQALPLMFNNNNDTDDFP